VGAADDLQPLLADAKEANPSPLEGEGRVRVGAQRRDQSPDPNAHVLGLDSESRDEQSD
jgi:hypothetical protein